MLLGDCVLVAFSRIHRVKRSRRARHLRRLGLTGAEGGSVSKGIRRGGGWEGAYWNGGIGVDLTPGD